MLLLDYLYINFFSAPSICKKAIILVDPSANDSVYVYIVFITI